MLISRNVFIAAPVEEVFSLLMHPEERAALNPTAKPLRVEIEDGAPLHEGSVCHYRLQVGNRIVDYHTRIVVLEPNVRIVSVSDSDVPFEIEVWTLPENGGTLLVQSESFEATDAMLQNALPEKPAGLMSFVDRALMWIDADAVIERRKRQEEALQGMLERNLDHWLRAIKSHLENH